MPTPPPARQHVWVAGPPQARGPHPGLIYRWERDADGTWKALTVYIVEADDALVQQWLPASALTPLVRPPSTH